MRDPQEIKEELVKLQERLATHPHEGTAIRGCMQGIMWASGNAFTMAPSRLFISDLATKNNPERTP